MTSTTPPPVCVYDPARMSWAPFEHPRLPGGELTPMVIQIDPFTMLAHFRPGFRAGRHSHPGGGTYFVLHGSMDFGDGVIVRAGMVRTVREGHEYGPETPDPVLGCTFLLCSRQPIHIDFVDDGPDPLVNGAPACI